LRPAFRQRLGHGRPDGGRHGAERIAVEIDLVGRQIEEAAQRSQRILPVHLLRLVAPGGRCVAYGPDLFDGGGHEVSYSTETTFVASASRRSPGRPATLKRLSPTM